VNKIDASNVPEARPLIRVDCILASKFACCARATVQFVSRETARLGHLLIVSCLFTGQLPQRSRLSNAETMADCPWFGFGNENAYVIIEVKSYRFLETVVKGFFGARQRPRDAH
jgi:hypothetical protein